MRGRSLSASVSAVLVAAFMLSVTGASAAETDEEFADWTVLVYLDGDNSLDQYGETDIEEMLIADFTEDVRVLVLWDRYELPAYLYEVRPGSLEVVHGLEVDGIDLNGEEIWMANPDILDAFVDFGTAMYPSEHLMVIPWDHGDPIFGICEDAHFEYPWFPYQFSLSYDDVGSCLIGHEVDVLAFDTCSAGMAEIAYQYGMMNELGGLSVDYIVGSEIYVPGFGFPYDDILTQMSLMADTSDALGIACMVVEEYAESYLAGTPNNGGTTACLSVIDPDAMYEACGVIRQLTQLLASRLQSDYETYKAIISEARGDANLVWGVPSSYGFVDFPRFVEGLTKAPGDKELRTVAKDVLTVLQTEVVLCFGGADAAESGGAMGLGTCFPPTYEEFVVFFLRYFFAFGGDTGWLDFLNAFWDT